MYLKHNFDFFQIWTIVIFDTENKNQNLGFTVEITVSLNPGFSGRWKVHKTVVTVIFACFYAVAWNRIARWYIFKPKENNLGKVWYILWPVGIYYCQLVI
jgi:hypothetical protein